MIRTFATVLAGLMGLAFGSFLNVCLSRWPEGESVVQPRSHCRNCGRTLTWWENVPLASWIALRGRCRTCKTAIGWRYPVVEFAIGVLWAFVAWHCYTAFDPVAYCSGGMVLTWALVALAVLDAEHLWLPNALTISGTVVGFVWSFLMAMEVSAASRSANEPWTSLNNAGEVLIAILAPSLLLLLIRWIYWLIRRREGIGLGDVKLMAMLGAWLGLSGALLSLVIGVFLGAIFALVLLAVPAARRASESTSEPWLALRLPLGTFLCIGGIITSLWGRPIINAYLHYAGL